VRRARNDLAGALAAYEEGLVIRRRLAAADATNAQARRDLYVSLQRLGLYGPDSGAACRHLREAEAMLPRLDALYPEGTAWRINPSFVLSALEERGCPP
jgi:hypothetical protein